MPGDQISLRLEGDQVVARALDGAWLGAIAGDVAARLARLAASEGGLVLAIREVVPLAGRG